MSLTKQENASIKRLFEILKYLSSYAILCCFDKNYIYLSTESSNLPVEICAKIDPDTAVKLIDYDGLLFPLVMCDRIKDFPMKKRDRIEKVSNGYSLFSTEENINPLVFNIMDLNTILSGDESITDDTWKNDALGKKELLTQEMKEALGVDNKTTVRSRILDAFYDNTNGEWISSIETSNFVNIASIDQDAIQKLINKEVIQYKKDDFFVILSKELFKKIKSDTQISIAEIGEEKNKKIGLLREVNQHVTIYTYFKTRKWNSN